MDKKYSSEYWNDMYEDLGVIVEGVMKSTDTRANQSVLLDTLAEHWNETPWASSWYIGGIHRNTPDNKLELILKPVDPPIPLQFEYPL